MHFNTILLLYSVLQAVAADCNHDNCLRAVLASAFPTRNGVADCDSYFLVTVTPATSTIDTTKTSTTTTTTDILKNPYARRGAGNVDTENPIAITLNLRQATVSPTGIPAYASACSGSVRYSSACSCVGATPSTITVATPLTTATLPATSIIVATSSLAPPSLEFRAYISSTTCTGSNDVFTNYEGICNSFTPYNVESLELLTFNPEGCATTEAGCTISYFSDNSCLHLVHSSTLMSNVCVNFSPYQSFEFDCPACPPY